MKLMSSPIPSRSWTVFYRYTIVTLVLSILFMVPTVQLATLRRQVLGVPAPPGAVGLLILQTIATTIVLCLLVDREQRGERLSWRVFAVSALPALGAAGSLLGTGAERAAVAYAVATCAVAAAAPLSSVRWWVTLPVLAVLVAVLAGAGFPVPAALSLLTVILVIVLLVRSTLWLLRLVHALEESRTVEAQLALAEERLRFSRDLHDVMGRDLSSIAVSAELVAKLAEHGDERAVEQARGIARTARSSLAEVRALARGYRDADLEAELRGTLSLMRSAGIDVEVTGAATDIPAEHASAAAWVLRETGTNLLRHARPHRVWVDLAADGIAVSNDGLLAEGPDGPLTEGTGLAGLRERLGADRPLTAERRGDRVRVQVRFTGAAGAANTCEAPASPANPVSEEA